MTSSRRRVATWSLSIASLVAIVVQVLVVLDRGNGRHVYVQRLFHPLVGLALVSGMMLAAIVLAQREGQGRGRLRLIGHAVAGGVLSICGLLAFVELLFGEPPAGHVVAASPGYQVAEYRMSGGLHDHQIVLRLRSRNGLASRESAVNLACFVDNERHEPAQAWFLDRVEFTAEHTIRVHATNGDVGDIDFRPTTLAPLRPVDECAVARARLAD